MNEEPLEAGLDALLDTVTNVVGVLLIVLILIFISVRGVMHRAGMKTEDPDVRQAREAGELIETQKRLELETAIAQENWRASSSRLAQLTQQVRQLRERPQTHQFAGLTSREELASAVEREAALEQLLHESRARRDSLHQVSLQLSSELRERKLVPNPKITIARVPDPHPAPINAEPLVYFCRYGRIYWYPVDAMAQALAEGLASFVTEDAAGIVPDRFQDVVRHFENQTIGVDPYRWKLKVVERMNIETGEVRRELSAMAEVVDVEAGETLGDLVGGATDYSASLQASDTPVYGRFYVWGDSFPAYVYAREMMDEREIAAGWVPCLESPEYRLVAQQTLAKVADAERKSGRLAPLPARRSVLYVPSGGLIGVPGRGGGATGGASGSGAGGTGGLGAVGSGPGVDLVD